ncbi:hemerythrin domain-containing protein [Lutibacter citreus]|uniref:hemerythrin domain-containing protein n=1 Tax=Lutibacter citreus TaxID=2138210 RepID=UPI000DBE008E|nr:hemerythrin domain-containing protein [Lutibacter citreus]
MGIKRHHSLQEYSKDHYQALSLCLKIQKGFSKGVATERIKKYVDWFYNTHILEHFQLEEKYVFPILGSNHELIIKALDQHKLLLNLFTDTYNIENSLKEIQVQLKSHVRFEERILFNEIQSKANKEELEMIEKFHRVEKFQDNLSDVFWK